MKLRSVNIAELVAAYWQHYLLSDSAVAEERSRAEHSFWAWEAVEAIAHGASTDGGIEVDPLDLIRLLADGAPDEDEALAYLGAGPVEDYLVYGAPDLARVERAAKDNPRFRLALRCAWFDNHLGAEDAAKLRRFGPPR